MVHIFYRILRFIPFLLACSFAQSQYYNGVNNPLVSNPLLTQFLNPQTYRGGGAYSNANNQQYQSSGVDTNSVGEVYDNFINSDVVRKSFDLTSRLLHRVSFVNVYGKRLP